MTKIKFLLLFLLIGCQDQTDKSDGNVSSDNNMVRGEKNNPQTCSVTLNNLRLREEPTQTGKVITMLKKDTELLDLQEWTAKEEKITIGNKTYSSRWRKVKVKQTGQEGWVFGAGLYCYYPEYNSADCDTIHDTGTARQILETVLNANNLSGKYKLLCNYPTHLIEGDFNGDQSKDVAILIQTIAKKDPKKGIIICSKENPQQEPFIIGAGVKFLGRDNYDEFGVFQTIEKGITIKSNWNEKTDDFYQEGETISPDDIVALTTDAIHVHAAEACGGGYIYWKNGKYNWLHDE